MRFLFFPCIIVFWVFFTQGSLDSMDYCNEVGICIVFYGIQIQYLWKMCLIFSMLQVLLHWDCKELDSKAMAQ